jgi:hypothetical protein
MEKVLTILQKNIDWKTKTWFSNYITIQNII